MAPDSSLPESVIHALYRQELAFEARYDALVAQFHQSQAAFHKLKQEYNTLRLDYNALHVEWERLRTVVAAKQAVITHLLPFYPHPLSLKLRRQIALT